MVTTVAGSLEAAAQGVAVAGAEQNPGSFTQNVPVRWTLTLPKDHS